MKFIHLSDLHIGKRVNDFSMLDDQAYILTEIIQIIDKEQPDAVLIAGDIYDKSVPSAEAVQLFDDFLTRLVKRNLSIFIISGNHDSAERVAFGAHILSSANVFIAPVFQGEIQPITLEDSNGKCNIYMLPFVKPAHVRRYFSKRKIEVGADVDKNVDAESSADADKGIEIETYDDAVKTIMKSLKVDKTERNLLIAHQFITGATRSDSEELSVGGLDNIDANAFDDFDYVALGHIHRPQKVGRDTIRYCGTPLKYSFSEADHKKSVTVVTMGEKGHISIDTVPLVPKHDLRKVKGSYEEITLKKNYEDTDTQDYVHITLTDEEDILDAIGKLRIIYPNIMKLEYDNKRTRAHQALDLDEHVEEKSPMQLFEEFYEKQNNQELNEMQRTYLEENIAKLWEEK